MPALQVAWENNSPQSVLLITPVVCVFTCYDPLQHIEQLLPCGCVFVCVSVEDSLLRQDDIWMLDGDDPQEPLSRAPRPDHLDFLRITPPEDDIIGDTPYCPKLERTVRAYKHGLQKHLQISCNSYFAPIVLLIPPFMGLIGISLHSGI